jgi:hypothetical protein
MKVNEKEKDRFGENGKDSEDNKEKIQEVLKIGGVGFVGFIIGGTLVFFWKKINSSS